MQEIRLGNGSLGTYVCIPRIEGASPLMCVGFEVRLRLPKGVTPEQALEAVKEIHSGLEGRSIRMGSAVVDPNYLPGGAHLRYEYRSFVDNRLSPSHSFQWLAGGFRQGVENTGSREVLHWTWDRRVRLRMSGNPTQVLVLGDLASCRLLDRIERNGKAAQNATSWNELFSRDKMRLFPKDTVCQLTGSAEGRHVEIEFLHGKWKGRRAWTPHVDWSFVSGGKEEKGAREQGPPLELIGWEWKRNAEGVRVDGAVKNLGDRTLWRVQAEVTWIDAQGKALGTQTCALAQASLEAGETVSFSGTMPFHTKMNTASIAFRDGEGQLLTHRLR